jgi:hypothetical protein
MIFVCVVAIIWGVCVDRITHVNAATPCSTETAIPGAGIMSFMSPKNWTTTSDGYHRVPGPEDVVFVNNPMSDVRDAKGHVSRMQTLAVTRGRVVVSEGALFVHRSRQTCPTTISPLHAFVVTFTKADMGVNYNGDVDRYLQELPGQMAGATVDAKVTDLWVADVSSVVDGAGVETFMVTMYAANAGIANKMLYQSMLHVFANQPFVAVNVTRPGTCTFRLLVRDIDFSGYPSSEPNTITGFKNTLPGLIANDYTDARCVYVCVCVWVWVHVSLGLM